MATPLTTVSGIAVAAGLMSAGLIAADVVLGRRQEMRIMNAVWPLTALVFVPLTLFGQRLFGSWVYDFVAAYALGVVFQYLTIKPMGDLSRGEALVRAVKADTLSLLAWQVGMYGWMAIVRFAIFDHELPKSSPVFQFMMQLGMLLGFATACPVNWWLLRRGIKEPM